jgi:basic membrane protein A and related proteins
MGKHPRVSSIRRGFFLYGMLLGLLLITGCNQKNSNTTDGNDMQNTATQRKILIVRNGSTEASFINQQILEGVNQVKTEIDNARIEISSPYQDAQALRTDLENFIKNRGEFVLLTDPRHSQVILDMAVGYPKVKFAILDGEIYPILDNGNVVSHIYDSYQIGYYMGYIAGKLSQTKNVLWIGGYEDDIRKDSADGFARGVTRSQTKTRVNREYIGPTKDGFESPQLAAAIANRYYLRGIDIIAHDAGTSAKGIFESAVKNQKFVIGNGVDQINQVGEYEGRIFYTSVIKRYDMGVNLAIKNLLSDFQSGNLYLDFRHEAIGIVIHDANPAIADLQDDLSELKEEIKNWKY